MVFPTECTYLKGAAATADYMKVLWLCNCPLSDADDGATGTWLGAMAHGLLDSGSIELGIIARGPVSRFTRRNYLQVHQWLVPTGARLGRDGLPSASLTKAVIAAVNEFSPDLIHIWGTEDFWGVLKLRGLLTKPSLLEMQGLKGAYAVYFYGGLTFQEQCRCIGIKEFLKCRTMHMDRLDFVHWGLLEEEIIRSHRFVDVQSAWIAAHVAKLNPAARLFPVDLVFRAPFYRGHGWQSPDQPTLFCSASYPVPYKGLHVAIRALGLLKKRHIPARLRIAGAHQCPGIRQSGYIRWINRLVRQLNLTDAIEWLGPLNADQIIVELQNAAAFVIPTFIENCCTAMQEAMSIGTPVVVSYTGGLPSLGKDEESCLFFPTGDEVMCAYQLERLLTNQRLSLRLSQQSRNIASVRNDRKRIVKRQLEIYDQMIAGKAPSNSRKS